MNLFTLEIRKCKLKGATIACFTGEGCQGMDEFKWIGRVIGFQKTKVSKESGEDIVIQVIKYNRSYGDNRDVAKKEIFTYPLWSKDLQNVDGVWILFK